MNKIYGLKLDSLDSMGQLHKIGNLLKLTQKEIDNLDSHIAIEEIKFKNIPTKQIPSSNCSLANSTRFWGINNTNCTQSLPENKNWR